MPPHHLPAVSFDLLAPDVQAAAGRVLRDPNAAPTERPVALVCRWQPPGDADIAELPRPMLPARAMIRAPNGEFLADAFDLAMAKSDLLRLWLRFARSLMWSQWLSLLDALHGKKLTPDTCADVVLLHDGTVAWISLLSPRACRGRSTERHLPDAVDPLASPGPRTIPAALFLPDSDGGSHARLAALARADALTRVLASIADDLDGARPYNFAPPTRILTPEEVHALW